MRKVVQFFQDPFRYKPTEDDVQLVAGIVNELKKIAVPKDGDFSFSPHERKFVEALVDWIRNTYTQYRFAACNNPVYRAYRESRATWKQGSVQNGPQYALDRISKNYWLHMGVVGRIDAESRDRLLGELEAQLLAPLSKSVREGGAIAKESRVDLMLDFLKVYINQGAVYTTISAAEEATKVTQQPSL